MQKERIQLGSKEFIYRYIILCCCFFLSGTAYISVIVQLKKRDMKTGVMGTRCRQTRVTLTVQAKLVVWELGADFEGNSYSSGKTGVMGTQRRQTLRVALIVQMRKTI